jgi:hypothetical protein
MNVAALWPIRGIDGNLLSMHFLIQLGRLNLRTLDVARALRMDDSSR